MEDWYKTYQWLKDEYDAWNEYLSEKQGQLQEHYKGTHGEIPWWDRYYMDKQDYWRKRAGEGGYGLNPYAPFYTGNDPKQIMPPLEPVPPGPVIPHPSPNPSPIDPITDRKPLPPRKRYKFSKTGKLYWGKRYFKNSKMRKRGVHNIGYKKGISVRRATKRKAKSFFIK